MPLAQLQLHPSYRTGRGDMVKDFFVPCLEQARRGPHASPRADSGVLAGIPRRRPGTLTAPPSPSAHLKPSAKAPMAARGAPAFAFGSGGQMRLVVSPHLEVFRSWNDPDGRIWKSTSQALDKK